MSILGISLIVIYVVIGLLCSFCYGIRKSGWNAPVPLTSRQNIFAIAMIVLWPILIFVGGFDE